MIKYKTNRWSSDIDEIEVERETEASVWVEGWRHAKDSKYYKYWDSWDDAYAHLLYVAENRLASARRQLQQAQGEYGNIKGMKKPQP